MEAKDGVLWIHQSDIGAHRKCPAALDADLKGVSKKTTNDKTIWGSAVHNVFEELCIGELSASQAVESGVETFLALRQKAIDEGTWTDTGSFSPDTTNQTCLSGLRGVYPKPCTVEGFRVALEGYAMNLFTTVINALSGQDLTIYNEAPMTLLLDGVELPNSGLKVGVRGTLDVLVPGVKAILDPKTGRTAYQARDAYVEHRYNPQPRLYGAMASAWQRGLDRVDPYTFDDLGGWTFSWVESRFDTATIVPCKDLTAGTVRAAFEEVLALAESWDATEGPGIQVVYLPSAWHCSPKWCGNFDKCRVGKNIADEYGKRS